jgi:hypothetical protein
MKTSHLYWGVIECGIGVIAACLPTLHWFVRRVSWEPVLSATKSFFSSQTSSAEKRDSTEATIYIDRSVDVIVSNKRSFSAGSSSAALVPQVTISEPLPHRDAFNLKGFSNSERV